MIHFPAGKVRGGPGRKSQQFRRGVQLVLLVMEHPQQVERVRIAGTDIEDGPIACCGARKIPDAMSFQRSL